MEEAIWSRRAVEVIYALLTKEKESVYIGWPKVW